MCGIISYFSQETKYNKDMKDCLSQLIAVDTLRGNHSTGLMIDQGEGEAYYYKKSIAGHDFVQLNNIEKILLDYNKLRWLVGHNRAATFGSINSNNAHPFMHDHITGVHNGTITNYRALSRQENFTVDSEHIIYALSKDKTKDVIPKINGSFALMWHNGKTDTLHFIRNNERPYCFGLVEGENTMLGASEPGMLSWIASRNGIKLEKLILPEAGYEYTFKLDNVKKPRRKKHELFVPYVNRNPGNHQSGRTVHYPPRTDRQGQGTASVVAGEAIKLPVQFYITKFDIYRSNKPNYGSLVCKTLGNDDAVVYAVDTKDYIVRNQWYEGTANWRDNQSGQLTIQSTSIKKLADEEVGTEHDLYKCCVCEEYMGEDDILFVDNTPVCLDCVEHFDISKSDVEMVDNTKGKEK